MSCLTRFSAMSVVVKESTPNLAYDENTSLASLMPNFKAIAPVRTKIQMDSKQGRHFRSKGDIFRRYEQKKLSFQGIDLKIGTIVEGMSVYVLAQFQNDLTTTSCAIRDRTFRRPCRPSVFEQMVLKKKTQFSSNQLETHQKDRSYLYLLWCQVTKKNLSNWVFFIHTPIWK